MSARTLSALSDRELLQRYIDSRCQDAFAELVARHGALVHAVCQRHLPREQDVEDAITISLSGLPLASALRLMLRGFDLEYMVADDVLTITTSAQAETQKQIHVYDIANVRVKTDSPEVSAELLRVLEQVTDKDQTAMAPFNGRIVVKAPFREHQRIMRLLRALQ